MSNLLNYLKNKVAFGKGIVKILQSNKQNHNILYKEMIKWHCSNSSLFYPYGTLSTINYSTISKEITPFQIITNNTVINIESITNKNNNNVDIYYFGEKVENDNIITYEIKNETKVFYLIINNKNTKKIIFYLL